MTSSITHYISSLLVEVIVRLCNMSVYAQLIIFNALIMVCTQSLVVKSTFTSCVFCAYSEPKILCERLPNSIIVCMSLSGLG